MTIRRCLLPVALLAMATIAFLPTPAFADGDAGKLRGARNLEKEMHRLEETMEELEEAIERAADAGQKDTAKQLKATLEALHFVKKQIAQRMEGRKGPKKAKVDHDMRKREKAAKLEQATKIKRELQELERRSNMLRELAQERGEQLKEHARVLRLSPPKTIVAKDEQMIIVATDEDGNVTRRVIRGDDDRPRGRVRLGGDVEVEIERLVRDHGDKDKGLRSKIGELRMRANKLRRAPRKDAGNQWGERTEHLEMGHKELRNQVKRLGQHLEELSHGFRQLQRQMHELMQANKKMHMRLQGAPSPRRVKAPKAPQPPARPVMIKRVAPGEGASLWVEGKSKGDNERLGRIEELLKKLLELQIKQAKAR